MQKWLLLANQSAVGKEGEAALLVGQGGDCFQDDDLSCIRTHNEVKARAHWP